MFWQKKGTRLLLQGIMNISKFCTVVSEVVSFVRNPVHTCKKLD